MKKCLENYRYLNRITFYPFIFILVIGVTLIVYHLSVYSSFRIDMVIMNISGSDIFLQDIKVFKNEEQVRRENFEVSLLKNQEKVSFPLFVVYNTSQTKNGYQLVLSGMDQKEICRSAYTYPTQNITFIIQKNMQCEVR